MDNTTTPETWKTIPGYEGQYEVSDQGRVRSLDRIVHQRGRASRLFPGRILRPNLVGKGYDSGGGYHALTLCPEPGARRRAYIHRLVMAAFVGPCPPGMEVCHEDGDPRNNALYNLRYDTPSANNMDKWRHGTMLNTYTGQPAKRRAA